MVYNDLLEACKGALVAIDEGYEGPELLEVYHEIQSAINEAEKNNKIYLLFRELTHKHGKMVMFIKAFNSVEKCRKFTEEFEKSEELKKAEKLLAINCTHYVQEVDLTNDD